MELPERAKQSYDKLYWYEQDTVKFMLDKYNYGEKGILIAHSPGLGKTPITCVFISALYELLQARFFLIVVPKSVIEEWRLHLLIWSQIPVLVYNGLPDKRAAELKHFLRGEKGVLVVTYETLLHDFDLVQKEFMRVRKLMEHENQRKAITLHPEIEFTTTGNDILDERIREELLAKQEASNPSQLILKTKSRSFVERSDIPFDIAIFDEITEIKNEASVSFKMFKMLPTQMKIGLTGTPVMNNLKELYNIVHFISPGFLGKRKTFVSTYASAIFAAELKDATLLARTIGQKYQRQLISELSRIMFRKTKEQLHALESKKHEILIWMNMGDLELQCYENYINSKYFRRQFDILQTDRLIPFQLISILRKTAEHCLKLNANEISKLPSSQESRIEELEEQENVLLLSNTESDCETDDEYTATTDSTVISDREKCILSNASSKVDVLLELLSSFEARRLKTIVFCEHRTMLNLLQSRIAERLHQTCFRIDGAVSSAKERSVICQNFNNLQGFQVLLMTIKAGGIGLNLQGAKRVVIFSPNWNPQAEEEAVGRAWRLGENDDVYVYKLIMRNTIEEKLVARQFQKLQIANATTMDLSTKTKVRAAEILELLICRTESNGNIQAVVEPLGEIEGDGIEATLSTKFDQAVLESSINTEEVTMIRQLEKTFEHFNLRINQEDGSAEEVPTDAADDAEIEEADLMQIPTIDELRCEYMEEGENAEQEVSTGQNGENELINLDLESEQCYKSTTAHTSDFEDDGKSELFDIVNTSKSQESFIGPPRRVTADNSSTEEDDISGSTETVSFLSRTVLDSSNTIADLSSFTDNVDLEKAIPGSLPTVIDIDDIDIFELTRRNVPKGPPLVIDLSD